MATRYELPADAPDSPVTGFEIDVGGWAHGRIGVAGDADFIAVDLVAGQSYTFALVGIGADNLTDPFLRLFAPDGTTALGFDDNGLANGNAILRFTATATGRHFLEAGGSGSLSGDYAVSAHQGDLARFDPSMIAGILDSHSAWTANRGTGASLSFGFAETNLQSLPGFTPFTEGQIEATRAVLALFADVADLTFTEVNPGGLTDAAVLLYGNYSTAAGEQALTGPPANAAFSSLSGDVWLNDASPPVEAPLPGSAWFQLMLHQVGLSLGLAQPTSGGLSYEDDAAFVQNSAQFSVMSPFGAHETGASALLSDTLGLYDIRALQVIYGANTTTRSGDDTYGFGATAGAVYDFDQNLDPMLTIWDAGGIDRLDLSRYSAAQSVSLAPGSHSSIGGFAQNLSIAFGTVIEQATGGRGADDITGNGAANLLQGGGGADILRGGAGRDTLEGGAGGDTLYGGAGNDVLWGDEASGLVEDPAVAFELVTTNGALGASLAVGGIDLFPMQSFTLEMIWQQHALGLPGEALRFGNLSLYRHADGSGSIHFADADPDPWETGILPPGLADGAAHRLSITYDDMDGRLVVYLDGVRTAERVFNTSTRGLVSTGDIALGDHATIGDIRLFDQVRSAQDIWDTAWSALPDPQNTAGLLHYWQGDGSGNLVNYLSSLPDLQGLGPVGTAQVLFGDSATGNRMAGGAGDDTYHVLSSLDQVIEVSGAGLDQVYAHVDFTLTGGQAVERLTVAPGSGGLWLTGNTLANRLTSAADFADTLRGGAGNDSYHLYHHADRVFEAAGGGRDTIYAFADHVLASTAEVEVLQAAGNGGRLLTGNALANQFVSNAAHADTLRGGMGDDTYILRNAGDRVLETAAGGGTDVIRAYVNHTLAAGSFVEQIHAEASRGLRLVGNERANQFFASANHADTLIGGAGNDSYTLRHAGDRVIEAEGGGWDVIFTHVNYGLVGGSAVEELRAAGLDGLVLRGNALDNRIYGGLVGDTLVGGAGQDRLWGGDTGARDVFVFSDLSHSAVGVARDVIHDFASGLDQINLRGIDADTNLAGHQAFGFSASGPMAHGVWLIATASGLILRADATGDGRADLEIGLTGLAGLMQADVLL